MYPMLEGQHIPYVGPYIARALPTVVGKNVILCTNTNHYHGQLSQYHGEHVVLHSNGKHINIEVAKINGILPKKV
ncbi:DUF2642 domain-containing protein [Paenibacillus xerothermodurans]|nr:DUF2642 domain-containing protein [Paenibacillus xerothermodurans]